MQIEPRVLSHMADDKVMIDAYVNGRDLYIEMAMNVFKLEREYCEDGAYSPCGTYQPRKRIKAVLLGIMYGMGAYTLSQSIQSTVEEAEQLIEDFYETYPDIKAFIDMTHEEAATGEFVETMFGRKRRFIGHKQIAKMYKAVAKKVYDVLGYVPSNIWREEIPYNLKQEFYKYSGVYQAVNRKSVNTKIQGTAADIMKKAMIRVDKVVKKYGFKMLATIHDEVLLEVPETITLDQVAELEEAMIGTVQLKVPVKTDVEFSYRWGSGISKNEWFKGERPVREVA